MGGIGNAEPAVLLAARSDWDSLARSCQATGRVQVPNLLQTSGLNRLQARLSSWTEWALVTRIEGRHRSFDATGMDQLDADRRHAFQALVQTEAQRGFQYLFERFPLVDHGRSGRLFDPVLQQAFALLRDPGFLDLGRRLLAAPQISFVDGQLTRYRAGHFLSLHDDLADGMNRVGAYVINLSQADWQTDWGGLLQFTDSEGRELDHFVPLANSLSLFKVPALHRVSMVQPQAQLPRLAITGWFRSADEPAVGSPLSG